MVRVGEVERDPMEVLTRAAEPPEAVVRYADHDCGLIDLFLPHRRSSTGRSADPHPLVVAIHGGFWHEEWDRTHLRPMANALVGRGFAVALPEYRRGPAAWSRTRDDIAGALDQVAGLVEGVAPGLVDPASAYTLTGHSAGGHLALWGGLTAGPHHVRRIVALAPVADLTAAARTGMGSGTALQFVGGTPDELPEEYAEADPMRLLPGDVPVVIVQGAEDTLVPVNANRAVADSLADAARVSYVELGGVEHFALVDPLTEAWKSTVLPALSGS
jgi:acetyl esterase/lipase